jgi:hypothetical protein
VKLYRDLISVYQQFFERIRDEANSQGFSFIKEYLSKQRFAIPWLFLSFLYTKIRDAGPFFGERFLVYFFQQFLISFHSKYDSEYRN